MGSNEPSFMYGPPACLPATDPWYPPKPQPQSTPGLCETCALRKELDALQLRLLIQAADIVELLRAREQLLVRVARLEQRHGIIHRDGD